jgi:hypothetical protein
MKTPIWTLMLCAFVALSHVTSVRPTVAQEIGADEKPRERVPDAIDKLFKDIDAESLKEPPKRDYKVAKGAERAVKLFKTDPRLLENKFVASARLLGMRNISRDPRPDMSMFHLEGQMVAELTEAGLKGGVPRFSDPSGHSLYSGRPSRAIIGSVKTPIRAYFSNVVPLCPKEELPSKDVVDFLTSAESDRDIVWTMDQTQGDVDWILEVYAASEVAAEQRLAAVIQILDRALCRPLQRICLTEGRKSLEAARKGYEDVANQSEALRVEEAKRLASTDISPGMLDQLKSQKMSVAIELAALNARVKACNEKLKELGDKPQGPQFETLSDIKLRGEIDVATSQERLDQINALIMEANAASALRTKVLQMDSSLGQVREKIRRHERRAESLGRVILLCEPLPLKDNQITVSPVAWTN